MIVDKCLHHSFSFPFQTTPGPFRYTEWVMIARNFFPSVRPITVPGATIQRLFAVVLGAMLATLPAHPALAVQSVKGQIRFGAEMAQKGNWREAIFRWKKALEIDPQNPRLHNNLAVAYETQGDFKSAEGEYKAALELNPHLKEARENYALFQNFYERYKKSETAHAGPPVEPVPPSVNQESDGTEASRENE